MLLQPGIANDYIKGWRHIHHITTHTTLVSLNLEMEGAYTESVGCPAVGVSQRPAGFFCFRHHSSPFHESPRCKASTSA